MRVFDQSKSQLCDSLAAVDAHPDEIPRLERCDAIRTRACKLIPFPIMSAVVGKAHRYNPFVPSDRFLNFNHDADFQGATRLCPLMRILTYKHF